MNSMVGIFRRGLLVLLCMVMQSCHPTPVNDEIPVGLTGVKHMTDRFSIGDFYVDGHWGGGLNREGNGGGSVAHTGMTLPREHRPGQTVQVKWTLFDEWYRTITTYEATVPVEPYTDSAGLDVHFFADAKVRVINSVYTPLSSSYPGPQIDDPNPLTRYPLKEVARGKVLSIEPYDERECWQCSDAERAEERVLRAKYKAEREAYEQAQKSKPSQKQSQPAGQTSDKNKE